ncbi:MAG: tRNA-guanine transglycosylase, partial [Deltaproteobacteria bacterium]|nr:tRNA-guanine transglycosylase [Deltaproteobacteria bacterium]
MTEKFFAISAQDPIHPARAGQITTRRGIVPTPMFMPIGTKAAVKAVGPDDLRNLGAKIVLANTYHLLLRPGVQIIETLGGLHSFMSWDGPILTDSGGYQIFSLSGLRTLSE